MEWQVRPPGGRDSYNTPLISRIGDRPALLMATWEHVLAYDPGNGIQLGSWNVPIRQCIPSIVADENRAYVMSGRDHGSEGGAAIRLGSESDDTEPPIAWQVKRSTAEIASPVLHGGLLYMVTRLGIATCLDAETGNLVWKKRIGGQHLASPVVGDGKVYFTDLDGKTTVVRVGRQYNELAKNSIGEETSASPAISDGKIFVRGKEHLFCIAVK